MWILSLLRSKWVIGSLVALIGAGVAGTSIWVNAKQSGFEKGYTRAEKAYTEQLEDTVNRVVENRDEQWSTAMEKIRDEINAIVAQNERTIQQERSLEQQLEEIQARLAESNERIHSADLGSCTLSPEFDRLFEPSDAGPAAPGGTPD